MVNTETCFKLGCFLTTRKKIDVTTNVTAFLFPANPISEFLFWKNNQNKKIWHFWKSRKFLKNLFHLRGFKMSTRESQMPKRSTFWKLVNSCWRFKFFQPSSVTHRCQDASKFRAIAFVFALVTSKWRKFATIESSARPLSRNSCPKCRTPFRWSTSATASASSPGWSSSTTRPLSGFSFSAWARPSLLTAPSSPF